MYDTFKNAMRWVFGASHNEVREEALVRSERAQVPLDLYQDLLNFSRNPDALLEDLANDGTIYKEMMRDGVVRSSINRKIIAVISQDWVVNPQNPDSEEEKKVAEFVTWALNNFQPNPKKYKLTISNFRTSLHQMCSAVWNGYSVNEMIFGPVQHPPHTGKVGIVAIKGKDPVDLKLKLDEHLNIIGITNTADGINKPIKPTKFVIFPWMQQFANPYGISDLQSAYRFWYLKRILVRMWAVALEKYAMPTALGKHPALWKQAQIEALEDAMRKMQQDNVITMQEDATIEFLQNATTSGSDPFISAMEACDKQILIAIEGASMHIIESRLTGSRNVGLVSADQSDLFTWFLSECMEGVINEQVIPKLVAANFENAPIPKFSFVDPGDEDLQGDTVIDDALLRWGVKLSESYFYEKYGRPEPKPDEPILQPPAQAAPAAPSLFDSIQPKGGE